MIPEATCPKGFELIASYPYDFIEGEIREWQHCASGAKLVQFACSDPQKAFMIGFRTPPHKGDGVAHILEHSVLCGSKKFPGKEPFASLLRSSLQTFLNAVTFPDRTVYPFATLNQKDYMNLLEVYLDAVFFPRMHDEAKIFAKEGHHLELDENNKPFITGVVYNEMRGALSGPERLMYEKINEVLYDNAYSYNSGGDPKEIEELTYEEFCQFHKDHYHPSNSFSIVYGDVDFEAVATKLNEYFEQFEPKSCNYVIEDSPLFDEERTVVESYPAASDQDKPVLSLNFLIGSDVLNYTDIAAVNILRNLALDNTSSKLQQELMNKGLAQLSYSDFNIIHRQPILSFYFKEVSPGKQEELKETVMQGFKKLCLEGFDKEQLQAALNAQAFIIKEANFDDFFPLGLSLGISCSNPLIFSQDIKDSLDFIGHLSALQKELDDKNSYYEELFAKLTINNPSRAWIEMKPQEGLLEQRAKEAQARAQKVYEALSQEEKDQIRPFQEELAAYAIQPDSPEDEAKIPKLCRNDLEVQINDYSVQECAQGVSKRISSKGISYLSVLSPLAPASPAGVSNQALAGRCQIADSELSLLSFLCVCLGSMSTLKYGFEELDTLSTAYLGNIQFMSSMHKRSAQEQLAAYSPEDELAERYLMTWGLSAAYLDEYKDKALDLLHEIYFNTSFEDSSRLKQILDAELARMKTMLAESGETLCKNRMSSYLSSIGSFTEQSSGLSYYEALKAMQELDIKELGAQLKSLYQRLLKGAGRFVYLANTQPEEELSSVAECFKCQDFIGLPAYTQAASLPLGDKGEGLALQSEVNYTGVMGQFSKDYSSSGHMRVAQRIVSLDYLWVRIRLEGGAYGCMHFPNTETMSIVSYRDPAIGRSYETYKGIAEFLQNLELSESELTDRIVASLGREQAPKTAAQIQAAALSLYLCSTPVERLSAIQEEILNCSLDDIKALSAAYAEALEHSVRCTSGNKEQLENEKNYFKNIIEII